MKKKVIVFGAGGSIGNKIVCDLLNKGNNVIASSREYGDVLLNCDEISKNIQIFPVKDVAKEFSLSGTDDVDFSGLDSVVYTVGHCPPDGFADEIKTPLSEVSIGKFRNEINMHQIGVLNVFQTMLPHLVDGGSFTFISSAITRVPEFPPFMHPYHHVSVIAAEDELIKGMRHDPVVKERNIKIHRIAPGAVDTPFHSTGPKPPSGYVSIEEVAKAVVEAIAGDEEVDRQILPQPK